MAIPVHSIVCKGKPTYTKVIEVWFEYSYVHYKDTMVARRYCVVLHGGNVTQNIYIKKCMVGRRIVFVSFINNSWWGGKRRRAE